MELDHKIALSLSRLGSRGAFGQTLSELGAACPELMVVVADTLRSAKLEDFAARYPEKLINVGICEQHMASLSAGLAAEGHKVFMVSFAPFATLRCYEQLKAQIGYMQLDVIIVGLLSGVAQGSAGNTHYALEDAALLRLIPGMRVISPADAAETCKAVEWCLQHPGPVYLRLTGLNGLPPVYKEDYDFVPGKAVVLREGTQVGILACGAPVGEALRAARLLDKQGLSCALANLHTLKPLDTTLLDDWARRFELLVSVEEHYRAGGLGSAVAEYTSALKGAAPLVRLGFDDEFPKAGSCAWLLSQHGLNAQGLASQIATAHRVLAES
ncbi:MAG: transketolase family protein [Succinivibrio sp.]|nr:transketolase family protein [Succinivibrio sp.]